MATTPDRAPAGYVQVGRQDDLARFLAEYELAEEQVRGLIAARMPPGVGGAPGPEKFLFFVHESLLRAHGEFPCAGDAEALSFCRQIAAEMVASFGIAPGETIARINRHWSQPGSDGREPRVWIVGRDIAYHETASSWAHSIYYGPDSRWWVPGAERTPLPSP
jgi:hypothetical protein